MRISDWSSALCSSDLGGCLARQDRACFGPSPARGDQFGLRRGIGLLGIDILNERGLAGAIAEFGESYSFAGLIDATTFERRKARFGRSEEQTSEIQSLMSDSYAVFCLK